MEPRIRVSAILRRETRILLCRHDKGGRAVWLLPGGGVNAGETLVDAVQRELTEECGIDDDLPLEGQWSLATLSTRLEGLDLFAREPASSRPRTRSGERRAIASAT